MRGMMQTSNPVLNNKAFQQAGSYGIGEVMTIQGTVNKSFVLLLLLVVTASWIWGRVFQPVPLLEGGQGLALNSSVYPLMMGGIFGGMIFAFITIFKQEWAGITAPIYALCEGLFIGGVSAIFERQYPGLVLQAVSLTFATLFCLLMAYKSGMIRATEKFKMGVVAATGAICVVYFINWIMSFFGGAISILSSSSGLGIGFSLIIVGIAALNLILDFDLIEQGASAGMPKYMEWYGAFGLMVTLVWLYLEILRLLAKLRDRR